MDPTLLTAQLYSGSYIPGGGPYKYTAPVSALASKTLVAAFNAGFRIQDSNGGYYTDGKNVVPLVNNAASVVIYRDGTMTMGSWGTQVWMSNQVASVRQNLDLIVNHGKAVAGLADQNSVKWVRPWAAVLTCGDLVWVLRRTAPLFTSEDRRCRSATSPTSSSSPEPCAGCNSTSTPAGSSSRLRWSDRYVAQRL